MTVDKSAQDMIQSYANLVSRELQKSETTLQEQQAHLAKMQREYDHVLQFKDRYTDEKLAKTKAFLDEAPLLMSMAGYDDKAFYSAVALLAFSEKTANFSWETTDFNRNTLTAGMAKFAHYSNESSGVFAKLVQTYQAIDACQTVNSATEHHVTQGVNDRENFAFYDDAILRFQTLTAALTTSPLCREMLQKIAHQEFADSAADPVANSKTLPEERDILCNLDHITPEMVAKGLAHHRALIQPENEELGSTVRDLLNNTPRHKREGSEFENKLRSLFQEAARLFQEPEATL
ncbi:MAG: hypothetical protein WAX89_07645 [Alphaproteobacteria bacterium]